MNRVALEDDVDLKEVDRPSDLPLLERWLQRPHELHWWGDPDLHSLARRSRSPHEMITAEGKPVG
jgi:hypothetical protein